MIVEKVEMLQKIITEMESENELIGSIFREGLLISLLTVQQIDILLRDKEEIDLTEIDQSEKIIMISKILGLDLKQVVFDCIEERNQQMNNINESKVADKETLDFITSGLDEYEKFLAENKTKDVLKELGNSIK